MNHINKASKIMNGQNSKEKFGGPFLFGLLLPLLLFLSRLFKYSIAKTLCKFSFTFEVISSILLYELLPGESEKGATATVYSVID